MFAPVFYFSRDISLSPLFTGSKMRQILTLITDVTNEFNKCVRHEISTKSKTNSLEFDTMDIMMRVSYDDASAVFGIQTNTIKQPDHEFDKMGKQFTYTVQGFRAMFCIAFPKLSTFLKIKILTDRQDRFFRNVISSTIAMRQKMKIERNDMLNLLLLAKEGKLNDKKNKRSDQDLGFATVHMGMALKIADKLKSKFFFFTFIVHFSYVFSRLLCYTRLDR